MATTPNRHRTDFLSMIMSNCDQAVEKNRFGTIEAYRKLIADLEQAKAGISHYSDMRTYKSAVQRIDHHISVLQDKIKMKESFMRVVHEVLK